ncbi:MAG: hypothetical protein H8M99_01480 [Gloeobacteraceae cyanobacterium ES-bin-144]|nr:hypothetical protein [Verrucomicrobiales bacterium]
MPPRQRRVTVQVAKVLGMDEETRAALAGVTALCKTRKFGVAGYFMPDDGVSARLAELGIMENVEEADCSRYHRVVIPYSGIPPRERRKQEQSGISFEDFSSPFVRRAQITLGLLCMEGAEGLVIGRHDDPESLALLGSCPGTKILEDTTDTARLRYAPAFGVVCQTTISPKRVNWLIQQLRLRYRDSRVTFLNTTSPSMTLREEALEKALTHCDRALIVGRAGESTCEALVETALRCGKPAVVVARPENLFPKDFEGNPKIALTAGGFALDETIHSVAKALLQL